MTNKQREPPGLGFPVERKVCRNRCKEPAAKPLSSLISLGSSPNPPNLAISPLVRQARMRLDVIIGAGLRSIGDESQGIGGEHFDGLSN